MALTAEQIDEQKKQAEELLFSGPQTLGFAKGLFFGHFNAPLLFPYPELEGRREADRRSRRRRGAPLLPTSRSTPPPSTATPTFRADVIDGLAELGVLGMTAPAEFGGRGFSQLGYCQDHGGHRRPLLLDRRLRQRPSLASASAPCSCSAPRSRSAAGCPTWSAARSWPPSP